MTAADPATNTPVIGGAGGQPFTLRCPERSVLTGIRAGTGMWVDRVRAWCSVVKPLYDGDTTLHVFPNASIETLGAGGGGPTTVYRTKQCDSGYVVVGASVRYGSYVHEITLKCQLWRPATHSADLSGSARAVTIKGTADGPHGDAIACDKAKQPAVGLRGRAGLFVDALGFICDEP